MKVRVTRDGAAVFRFTLALVLALGTTVVARAQGYRPASGVAGTAPTIWTLCMAEGRTGSTDHVLRRTLYLTSVMPSAAPADSQAVGKAFARFVEASYLTKGVHAVPTCWSARSAADAQSAIQQPGTKRPQGIPQRVDCSRANVECVMTGWAYARK